MVSSSPALLMIIKITYKRLPLLPLSQRDIIIRITSDSNFFEKLNLNDVRHILRPTWTVHFEFRTFTILHASVFFLYFIVSENKRMKYFLLKAYCQSKLVGLKCPTKMTVCDFLTKLSSVTFFHHLSDFLDESNCIIGQTIEFTTGSRC